jgi:hypothetical protein
MALRTIAYGFVFYAYGMVIGNSFNGAGDTRTPTWINLFVFWALEIPLAWVLSHQTGLGVLGVFVAMTIAFSTLGGGELVGVPEGEVEETGRLGLALLGRISRRPRSESTDIRRMTRKRPDRLRIRGVGHQ